MSIRADITPDYGWHRFETKNIEITVVDDAGDAVNLSSLTLEWLLTKQAGDGAPYLDKGTGGSGITVSGASNNVAVIAVASTQYESATRPLVPGIYHHELWDRTNNNLLSFGMVHLLAGSKAIA